MFYSESTIKNLLKCEQCYKSFSFYDPPKILPCNRTICFQCAYEITNLKNSSNRGFNFVCNNNSRQTHFKCKLCLHEHEIPMDDFITNELAFRLNKLNAVNLEDICNGKYLDLRKKIDEFRKQLIELEFAIDNSEFLLIEHCRIVVQDVQLKNEQEQLRYHSYLLLNSERSRLKLDNYYISLIEEIERYKNRCIENIKNSPKIMTSASSANNFLKVVENYLNHNNINENQTLDYIETATIFLNQLKEQTAILIKNIFLERKISFNISKNTLEYKKHF